MIRHCPSALAGNTVDHFWVVTCYFNPCGYTNRLRNYIVFARNLRRQGVRLCTAQLRRSPDEARLPCVPGVDVIDLIESSVLWCKERILQKAIASLPPSCTQVCWCDCDLLFADPDWARNCAAQLDVYRVVQPFSHVHLLADHRLPIERKAEA